MDLRSINEKTSSSSMPMSSLTITPFTPESSTYVYYYPITAATEKTEQHQEKILHDLWLNGLSRVGYSYIGKVGAGSFGEVSVCSNGKKIVAIKRLKSSSNLMREVTLLEKCQHEFVVQYFGLFDMNGRWWTKQYRACDSTRNLSFSPQICNNFWE
jgi:hypothetical protein